MESTRTTRQRYLFIPFVWLLNVCTLFYCNTNTSVVCAIKITYLLITYDILFHRIKTHHDSRDEWVRFPLPLAPPPLTTDVVWVTLSAARRDQGTIKVVDLWLWQGLGLAINLTSLASPWKVIRPWAKPIDLSLCGADHVRGRVKFPECCGNLVAELEARAKFPGRQLATFTFSYKKPFAISEKYLTWAKN